MPTSSWLYPVLGYGAFNAAVHAEAVAQVAAGLAVLEGHLLSRTYLVGNKVRGC